MRAVDIIRRKRDGGELTPSEIEAFVAAAAHDTWPEYQLSALLMAIWLNGMTPAETAHLTHSMCHSGKRYDWSSIPGPKVDKHSTGGVGDKTSLILAPLVAACDGIVPMMSGRGLGHTGGTLDKLESIPGFRVGLHENELREALAKIGVGLIGQTAAVAPADKKLYALRDVTATVESIPLITASILSKKLAEGIDALVMDVKVGRGAFMKTLPDARALAKSIVSVGAANGLKTEALITAMEHPLGRAIGNSLEIIECIETLKGNGPRDLETLSVTLAARMIRLAGLAADDQEAERKIRDALTSGAGLEKFRAIIEQQRGDPRVIDDYSRLPSVSHRHYLKAERNGYVADLNAELLGHGAMVLGAGRHQAEDQVDHAVGIIIHSPVGTRVTPGDDILEIHYRDDGKLQQALHWLSKAVRLESDAPAAMPLIHEILTEET
ncbi:MAG: thymidine phosphorylase [Planctomycetes bacterium]|nr:thymidine phosphorylase [Planctomycetota bacterium]